MKLISLDQSNKSGGRWVMSSLGCSCITPHCRPLASWEKIYHPRVQSMWRSAGQPPGGPSTGRMRLDMCGTDERRITWEFKKEGGGGRKGGRFHTSWCVLVRLTPSRCVFKRLRPNSCTPSSSTKRDTRAHFGFSEGSEACSKKIYMNC